MPGWLALAFVGVILMFIGFVMGALPLSFLGFLLALIGGCIGLFSKD